MTSHKVSDSPPPDLVIDEWDDVNAFLKEVAQEVRGGDIEETDEWLGRVMLSTEQQAALNRYKRMDRLMFNLKRSLADLLDEQRGTLAWWRQAWKFIRAVRSEYRVVQRINTGGE